MNGLEVTNVELRAISGGSLKAYADVTLNGTLVVKGWKVFEGSKGTFVKPPDIKGKDAEGADKYFPTISFTDENGWKDNFVFDAVLAKYKGTTSTGKSTGAGKPGASRTAVKSEIKW